MPDIVQNGARVGNQEQGKLAIVGPRADDGGFVNLAGAFIEEERDGGNVGLGAIETDVALALLFGIIEGVGVEEGPDELTADVFEAELEVAAAMLRRCLSVISSGVMRREE
jgi:hypothetical protein